MIKPSYFQEQTKNNLLDTQNKSISYEGFTSEDLKDIPLYFIGMWGQPSWMSDEEYWEFNQRMNEASERMWYQNVFLPWYENRRAEVDVREKMIKIGDKVENKKENLIGYVLAITEDGEEYDIAYYPEDNQIDAKFAGSALKDDLELVSPALILL